jgi:hypothetical protein
LKFDLLSNLSPSLFKSFEPLENFKYEIDIHHHKLPSTNYMFP